MCDRSNDPTTYDIEPWATEAKPVPPVDLILIEGSFNEHALAADLVRYGHALVARVISKAHDYIGFEAYRLSPTSTSYAWRTPTMAVPAFMPVEADPRSDVYGQPRWQWELAQRGGVQVR